MTLNINIFTYFIIFFLTLLICSVNAERSEADKPNIIMIVADDLGYNDVGFNGSLEIKTPNIDRIAQEGIVFTHGYVTHSICAPSRAAILTGKYQQKFGFEKNPSAIPNSGGVPDSEINLAEVLKMSGYKTAAIGKWHLGSGSNYSPNHRGFDYFFGFERGGSNYFPELLTLESYSEVTERYGWYNLKILENEKPVKINSYLTDELSSSAVEFVKKSKDSPFFLYLAYNTPHAPMQADPKVYETINIKDPSRRTYAAMVKSLDNGVGRILDVIDELNLEKNTMVIFLSDNGGADLRNFSDNGALRGSKSEPYEGGIRVPMAIKWPSVYPSGLFFDKNISSLDFFSTIIGSANIDFPKKKSLDGVDLTPCLVDSDCSALDRFLYFRSQAGWKVVLSPHSVKIVSHDITSQFKKKNTESYDLINDPSEEHPNYKDHQHNHSDMKKNYKLWAQNFPGPSFSGAGNEGFPELTLFFRIKRKINFIIFHLNRNFKTYLGIY